MAEPIEFMFKHEKPDRKFVTVNKDIVVVQQGHYLREKVAWTIAHAEM